ncbi:ADP-ribosylglycohydrolase family protein [Streptomyces avermitilis]
MTSDHQPNRLPSASSPFPSTPSTPSTPFDVLAATRDCLNGLAVGDAFGAQFFVPDNLPALREQRLPPAPWPWTDDTEMACSVERVPRTAGFDQDALARSFAEHHDFDRGYGPSMNRLLRLVRQGESWRDLAAGLFEGQGSWGNGAAMRVAPLGVRFAADLPVAAEQAARSAEVTHTHPEAAAGAIAVAVAAGFAARGRTEAVTGAGLLDVVMDLTPASKVRAGVERARLLLDQPHVELAAHTLGNGRLVSAVDTVPFTLWCAARHLDDYQAALWVCAAAGGDVDTTCAIVGGIVAAHVGTAGIPAVWRQRVEPLPPWFFGHAAASWSALARTLPGERHPCVCCGRLVHDRPPGSYDICPLCFWEDDAVQLRLPTAAYGPNRIALVDAQVNARDVGACTPRDLSFVRPPLPDEPVDPDWRPIDPLRDRFEDPDGETDARLPWPTDRTTLYWWRPTFWNPCGR